MKKYLGIVKIYEEQMSGVNIELLSKTYDDVNIIKKWFTLYPDCEHIILLNDEKLDSMFKVFKDMTPITKEEKEELQKTKKLYKKLISKEIE